MNAPLECGRCGKPIEPGTGYVRDGDKAIHLDCSRAAKRGPRLPARPVTPARKERRRSS
jgi:ribosomal protein L24E